MTELTARQQQELGEREPVLVDPRTQERYVLVRKAVFDRMRELLQDDVVFTTADMLDRVMAQDDAQDPHLAELQKKYGAVP